MRNDDFFRPLVAQYKDMVYRICCAYTRDPDARHDLYQEVLIHIWKGSDSFRNEAHITTWLYRITVNACLTWIRGEQRRNRRFLHTSHEEFENVASDEHSTSEMDETLQQLYECISRLRPLDRLLVSLYLEGSENSEIAGVMGITEGNVRVKLHRIKHQLRKTWKEAGYEP